jgi:Amt family ammonium transporter
VVCFVAVTEVKKRLGYDDSLDAFGVHGVGGFTGAILTGVFANSAINTVFKDEAGNALPSGLLEGNSKQVLNQLIAAVIAIVLGMVGSWIILKVVDLVVGVRASGEDETVGLDVSQHGEEGYNLDFDFGTAGTLASHSSSDLECRGQHCSRIGAQGRFNRNIIQGEA